MDAILQRLKISRNFFEEPYISAIAGRKMVRGAWNWQKGFWCRNVVVGPKEWGFDYQFVELDGQTLRGTRKKRKGDSYLFTVN